MISKNEIKLINQLRQKKYRKKTMRFVAEGLKTVKELLASDFELHKLYASADILYAPEGRYELITEAELKKISNLKTSQMVLAVFDIPKTKIDPEAKLSLALDGVRDPGNLGTIIRLCDWFGIGQLVCSTDSADCYNPKTVQATMGSLSRVRIVYADLEAYLSESKLPIIGTFMDGEPIYGKSLPKEAIVVMGNEANGISQSVEELVSARLSIPQFGKKRVTESLNVATATAIVLNEFMRG